MSAEILTHSFLSKAAKEDLAYLKDLHGSVYKGTRTPEMEKLNTTLEAFYNEVASGTRSPVIIERRILDMKDMLNSFIYTGRCAIPA